MKMILIFIVTIVIFVFQNNKCNASDCNDPLLNCGTWTLIDDTLEIEGFPGCFIICSLYYRMCTDNQGNQYTELKMYSFRQPLFSPICDSLFNSFYIPYGDTLNGTYNWNFALLVFKRLGEAHAKKVFLLRYNSTPPEDKWEYECPNMKTEFILVHAACMQIAVFPRASSSEYDFRISNCINEICCKEQIDMCWDKLNNELVILKSWEPLSPICDVFMPPVPGSLFSSDCFPWCEMY